MELKATTIDNWNALLNPGFYNGGTADSYPEESPTGCLGACEMPPCMIPKLECRRLLGSASFHGFYKPDESDSESHSSGWREPPPPLRPTRYMTEKTVYFHNDAQTTMTKFPGGPKAGSYASQVRSGTVEITRTETYDFSFKASIGGDFTGTCAAVGEENTHTVYSGGGSITTKDYYAVYEGGAWVSKLGLTTVVTYSKASDSSAEEGSDASAEDNRFDNIFRSQKTQVPAPATPFEPEYGVPPIGPERSRVYSSPVTWAEAFAEAEAWIIAQIPVQMEKGDKSDSTDSDFCTLSKSCGITTTTNREGFLKYYGQYRWKLHRCSGSYAGLTWQEVVVPQELVNWVNYQTFPATPKPTANLTTTQKAWEYNGSAPGPRCVPWNNNPYPTEEEYSDQTRWSPWSALIRIPGSQDGWLLLRNGLISCYRSDYGTVPTEIFGRRGYAFDDMSDLNANGIPDKSE